MLVCALKFATMVPPGAFTEEGAKLTCMPEGTPVALTDTLPVSPPSKVIVKESVGFVPTGKLTVAEEAVIENCGEKATVRLSAAVSVVEPLVPVTVRGYVPGTAVAETVKVSVLPAEPETEVGLKAAVTPVGSELRLSATVPLKVPNSLTVTLLVPVVPCTTLTGVVVIEKPLPTGIGGNAFCTSWRNSVSQKVPAGGEFGIEPTASPLASVLSCAGSQFSSPWEAPRARCAAFVSPLG